MASRSIEGPQETEMLEVNSMFTKQNGKLLVAYLWLVAPCYVWKGNTIINEDRSVVAVLN